MQKTPSIIIFLFLSLTGYSQNKNVYSNEIVNLSREIEVFISGFDNVYSTERQSEFAQLIIKTDSNGKINRTRSMAIETDSIGKIFKKMTPASLVNWNGPKSKTILIPFFYLAANPNKTRNYVDTIFLDYYRRIPGYTITAESGSTIVLKWMLAVTPIEPRTEANRVNKVDTLYFP
jgi:hypothetical protein